MVRLDLTTWERLVLAGWINTLQGDIRKLRILIGLLDRLELSEEERAGIGYDQAGDVARWEDTDRLWPVTFGDQGFDILRGALGADWPASRLHLAMLEKLEAACAGRVAEEGGS